MDKKKATARQARYDAAHTKRINLKLNLETDADILEKLDAVESKQGYIKHCIREELACKVGTNRRTRKE